MQHSLFIILACLASLSHSAQLNGPVWAKSLGGNGSILASSLAIDPATGDTYVTGDFYGDIDFDPGAGTTTFSSNSTSAYVAKYNANGELQWAVPFSSFNDGGNNATREISLNSGYLYVYGKFDGTVDFDPGSGVHEVSSESTTDLFVLKLDTSGNFQWVSTVTSETTFDARMLSVDTGVNGGVYITGNFEGLQEFDPNNDAYDFIATYQGDGYVCKFDLDGNFLWAITMRSHLEGMVEGVLASDAGNGHCFIFGQYYWDMDFDTGATELFIDEDDDNSIEGFVAELDENGAVVWYKILYSSNDIHLYGFAKEGALVITGDFKGTVDFDPGPGEDLRTSVGFWKDVFVLKLDLQGNYEWVYTAGGDEYDYGWDIAVNNTGMIFGIGTFEEGMDFDGDADTLNTTEYGEADVFVIQMSPGGTLLDVQTIGGSTQENSSAIAADNNGHVYATGFYRSDVCNAGNFELENALPGDFAFDVFLVQYSLEGFIETVDETNTHDIRVYPNPADDALWIEAQQAGDPSEITLYDATAKRVLTTQLIGQRCKIDISKLEAGVYTLAVANKSGVRVKKVVLE